MGSRAGSACSAGSACRAGNICEICNIGNIGNIEEIGIVVRWVLVIVQEIIDCWSKEWFVVNVDRVVA